MSSAVKRKIVYWVCLIAGVLGIAKQIHSYLNDTLELTVQEFCLTVVCVTIALKPNIITESYVKLLDKFTRKDNE